MRIIKKHKMQTNVFLVILIMYSTYSYLETGTGSAKVKTSVHFAVELVVIDIEGVWLEIGYKVFKNWKKNI